MTPRRFDPAFAPLPNLFIVTEFLQQSTTKTKLSFDSPLQVTPPLEAGETWAGIKAINADTSAVVLPLSITQTDIYTCEVIWASAIAYPFAVRLEQWGTSIRGLNGGYAAPAYLELPLSFAKTAADPAKVETKEEPSTGDSPSPESGGQQSPKLQKSGSAKG